MKEILKIVEGDIEVVLRDEGEKYRAIMLEPFGGAELFICNFFDKDLAVELLKTYAKVADAVFTKLEQECVGEAILEGVKWLNENTLFKCDSGDEYPEQVIDRQNTLTQLTKQCCEIITQNMDIRTTIGNLPKKLKEDLGGELSKETIAERLRENFLYLMDDEIPEGKDLSDFAKLRVRYNPWTSG